MTKISQLTSTSKVGDPDLFVVSQAGTTYRATAASIKEKINEGLYTSDVVGGTPNDNQYATPYLQKNLAYGVPSAIEFMPDGNGAGYDTATFQGKILACVHDTILYTPPPSASDPNVIDDSYDASAYLARGLEVKVEVHQDGFLSTVRIVQPGQLYRIGDVLEVSNYIGWMDDAAGGGNQQLPTSADFVPARIKIVDIEPFMTGAFGVGSDFLGSCTSTVQTDQSMGPVLTNKQSDWSTAAKNPQKAQNFPIDLLNEGGFVAMENDWSASIYHVHTEDTAAETAIKTTYGPNVPCGGNDILTSDQTFNANGLVTQVNSIAGGPAKSTVDWLHVDLPGTWLVGGMGMYADPVTTTGFPNVFTKPGDRQSYPSGFGDIGEFSLPTTFKNQSSDTMKIAHYNGSGLSLNWSYPSDTYYTSDRNYYSIAWSKVTQTIYIYQGQRGQSHYFNEPVSANNWFKAFRIDWDGSEITAHPDPGFGLVDYVDRGDYNGKFPKYGEVYVHDGRYWLSSSSSSTGTNHNFDSLHNDSYNRYKIDCGPVKAAGNSGLAPSSRYINNQWNKGFQDIYAGLPMVNMEWSAQIEPKINKGINLYTSLTMQKQDISDHVRNEVESGVYMQSGSQVGRARFGRWEPQRSEFPGTTDDHGKAFEHNIRKNLIVPEFSGAQGNLSGFFIYNVRDVMPRVTTD